MVKLTVEEALQAAERSKLPNINYSYLEYEYPEGERIVGEKIVKACLIGAAAIELGTVWSVLAEDFRRIKPDDGIISSEKGLVQNLTEYLAVSNNDPDRKVVTAEIRKLFAKSLGTIIEI